MKSGSMGRGSIMLMVIVPVHLMQVSLRRFLWRHVISVLDQGNSLHALGFLRRLGRDKYACRAAYQPDRRFRSRAAIPGFSWFANRTAQLSGSPATFLLATASVVVWAVTGRSFISANTWQLVNQHQYDHRYLLDGVPDPEHADRDTTALQVKLDELILALDKARNDLVGIEEEPEEMLERVKEQEHRKARDTPE